MIQITVCVDGQPCTMLTPNTPEGAHRSCQDRFGSRFDGLGPVSIEDKANSAWSQYKSGGMNRKELEAWLSEQGDDEQEIRAIFNDRIKKKGA